MKKIPEIRGKLRSCGQAMRERSEKMQGLKIRTELDFSENRNKLVI